MRKNSFITPGQGVALTLLRRYWRILDAATRNELISELPTGIRKNPKYWEPVSEDKCKLSERKYCIYQNMR